MKNSLKPLKKSIQNKENLFQTIRHVYPHLSSLSNDEILEYYQVPSLKALDTHIALIKTILKKQTENYKEEKEALHGCFCIDSHGDFKYLYESKKEAENQRLYSLKSKRVKLTLYNCPFHCGWHLSKL